MASVDRLNALVEGYLISKCDPCMKEALQNILKVIFYNSKQNSGISELEILLSEGTAVCNEGETIESEPDKLLPSDGHNESNVPDGTFYSVPPLEPMELENSFPAVEFGAYSECNADGRCMAVTSDFYLERLVNERPEENPEHYSYIIVGPLDPDDYVLESPFYEELGELIDVRGWRSPTGSKGDDLGEQNSPQSWCEMSASQQPQVVLSPAKPQNIVTPLRDRNEETNRNDSSTDSFLEETDPSCVRQASGQHDINQYLTGLASALELSNEIIIRMNNRMDFPMRCKCVREICNSADVPLALEFLNSSFDIPVHYEVYGEYQGLAEYNEAQQYPMFLAARYLVVDAEYNDDGVFGQVLCAYDVEDRCYVALKRSKSPECFGELVNEIRTLLYINCHDRSNGYRHFSHLRDFFIQHGSLFMVLEFLGENLYRLACRYQSERARTFSVGQLQTITQRVLESVEFLERLGIQHLDIKPENIVLVRRKQQAVSEQRNAPGPGQTKNWTEYSGMAEVRRACGELGQFGNPPVSDFELDDEVDVKLIDIGSHRFFEPRGNQHTPYVQSRFYRAPEVILQLPYDSRTEVFSVGCVLYELACGDPLFVTDVGQRFYQQELANYIGLLGPIPEDMLILGRLSHRYFTRELKLYATAEQLAGAFDERFVLQGRNEVEGLLDQTDNLYLQPLRRDFEALFRDRLTERGYFEGEQVEDVLRLVNFVRLCLTIDLRRRPPVSQLLASATFAGGCGQCLIVVSKTATVMSLDLILDGDRAGGYRLFRHGNNDEALEAFDEVVPEGATVMQSLVDQWNVIGVGDIQQLDLV